MRSEVCDLGGRRSPLPIRTKLAAGRTSQRRETTATVCRIVPMEGRVRRYRHGERATAGQPAAWQLMNAWQSEGSQAPSTAKHPKPTASQANKKAPQSGG